MQPEAAAAKKAYATLLIMASLHPPEKAEKNTGKADAHAFDLAGRARGTFLRAGGRGSCCG